MNRFVPCFAFALLILTSGCTFDLTEVPLESRDPRIAVVVEATRGSDTRISIQIDPGTADRGQPRTLVHESVLLNGTAYARTGRYDELRAFEVVVAESIAAMNILLPSIAGMTEIPAFIAVPLRVAAPDTLADNAAGVLEIPVLGTGEGGPAEQSSWKAALFGTDTSSPQLFVAGAYSIPAVLRVPTIHLPADVQEGHVEVSGASRLTILPETSIAITLHRVMRASIPFRIVR